MDLQRRVALGLPHKVCLWMTSILGPRHLLIIKHRLNCAFILAYYSINDKTVMVECIIYHVQNCIILDNFISSLKGIWELMFLCILYPLIYSIVSLSGF